MCGIVGIVGNKNVSEEIFESLAKLEYRGYDSAGIAVISNNPPLTPPSGERTSIETPLPQEGVRGGLIIRQRAEGKLANLRAELDSSPLNGNIGIGHTRWATHGLPITENAHPHSTAEVSVVHNGIIENFLDLRSEMEKAGHKFTSETDTEVIPVLITYYLGQGDSAQAAFQKTLSRLEGAFAIGAIFAAEPDLLMAAKQGSPLAIGYGDGATYMASDAIALSGLSNKVTYLEDGDFAALSKDGAKIFDQNGDEVEREIVVSNISGENIGKGNFEHYMLKEIHDQPTAIAETLNAYYDPLHDKVNLPNAGFDLDGVRKITILACGTSHYAALIGKYWIEKLARIPVEVDIASEFRYREPVYADKGGLVLAISQSGETADTLAAVKHAKAAGQKIAAIVNVPQSSIAREADLIIPTLAGPEIGVASTKAFTAQLTNLATFAIALAPGVPGLLGQLTDVPAMIAALLHDTEIYQKIADDLSKAKTILYIGRGTSYPIALEGALKLKEISYIHAEGFGAGELKHGPIALIDENVPVVVVAPYDEYFGKTASNIREVTARGGKVVLISNAEGCAELKDEVAHTIEMPFMPAFVTPILYALPVQLLAYYTALKKGTDIDQPRNLAKSVTVE